VYGKIVKAMIDRDNKAVVNAVFGAQRFDTELTARLLDEGRKSATTFASKEHNSILTDSSPRALTTLTLERVSGALRTACPRAFAFLSGFSSKPSTSQDVINKSVGMAAAVMCKGRWKNMNAVQSMVTLALTQASATKGTYETLARAGISDTFQNRTNLLNDCAAEGRGALNAWVKTHTERVRRENVRFVSDRLRSDWRQEQLDIDVTKWSSDTVQKFLRRVRAPDGLMKSFKAADITGRQLSCMKLDDAYETLGEAPLTGARQCMGPLVTAFNMLRIKSLGGKIKLRSWSAGKVASYLAASGMPTGLQSLVISHGVSGEVLLKRSPSPANLLRLFGLETRPQRIHSHFSEALSRHPVGEVKQWSSEATSNFIRKTRLVVLGASPGGGKWTGKDLLEINIDNVTKKLNLDPVYALLDVVLQAKEDSGSNQWNTAELVSFLDKQGLGTFPHLVRVCNMSGHEFTQLTAATALKRLGLAHTLPPGLSPAAKSWEKSLVDVFAVIELLPCDDWGHLWRARAANTVHAGVLPGKIDDASPKLVCGLVYLLVGIEESLFKWVDNNKIDGKKFLGLTRATLADEYEFEERKINLILQIQRVFTTALARMNSGEQPTVTDDVVTARMLALVTDNVNIQCGGKSINMMHTIGIFNQVTPPTDLPRTEPQGRADDIPLREFIGGDYDRIQNELRLAFSITVLDWWLEHVSTFSAFAGMNVKWPTHAHEKEWTKKSEWFGIGVWRLDENKREDMVELLKRLYEFVPHDVCGGFEHVIMTLLGGDQMTRALLSGRQRDLSGEPTSAERREGLVPQFLDLHGCFAYLEAVWRLGYDTKSVAEKGTLYYIQHILRMRAVTKKPHQCYDPARELLLAMGKGCLKSSTQRWFSQRLGKLSDFLVQLRKKDRKSWSEQDKARARSELMQLATQYVDEFVMPAFDYSHIFKECERIDEEENKQRHRRSFDPPSGGLATYPQRFDPAPDVEDFVATDAREEQEENVSSDLPPPSETDQFESDGENVNVTTKTETGGKEAEDRVNHYLLGMLALALFFASLTRSISVGDGGRVVDTYYKVMQLLFMGTRKRNYNLECIFLTCLTRALLTETAAYDLTWNRFANVLGGYARCMSRDALNEAGNRYCKSGSKNGGLGRAEQMDRLSQAQHIARGSLSNFDKANGAKRYKVAGRKERAGIKGEERARVNKVASALREVNGDHAFAKVPGRSYPSFPNTHRSLFGRMDPALVTKNIAVRRKRVSDRQSASMPHRPGYLSSMVLPKYKPG
jgi:hypothetical protein